MNGKITLLGDSIRFIGYGKKLPELLGEEFTVFQPNENCRFSKYTLRGVMVNWAADIADSDIIHWNNGLWDTMDHGEGVLTSEDEYVANMIRIADILKKRAKKVIFATTTPVAPDYQYSNIERIERYNAILVPELEKRGIIINDMYSFVQPNIDTYIRKDDHIHLTEEGIWACAKRVKEVILENL
ncbi:MAG: SGNH/GDSL hydrolase family protein [Lachnospiraceae bacterium]|nr:SGNH/GDSL hydrolase family protein [Lachnospiraceae bacterium]